MALRHSDNISQLSTGSTVAVVVGTPPNSTTKDIFVRLLSAKSGWFRDEFARQPIVVEDDESDDDNVFIEQSTPRPPTHKPVILPECDPAAFHEFHKWLVKDALKVSDADLLCKSYVLAHQFRSEGMRNQLVDDVRDFFATNRGVRVSLESMVALARQLPPHRVSNGGQNRLLEFLVWQLTFEIVVRGYEHYESNEQFHLLLGKSDRIVRWHLKALHDMNPSQAAARAKKTREKKNRERARRDAAGAGLGAAAAGRVGVCKRETSTEESEESEGKSGAKKMVKLHTPENPSKRVGCFFHEHLDTKDCGGKGRRRVVVIDP